MTPLDQKIRDQIKATGPLRLDIFMEAALADPEFGYYMQRTPFGRPTADGGDFITAPEVSQIFGELLAIWCIDLWQRAGQISQLDHIELGPGRGTLAADMRRVFAKFALSETMPCHLVDMSPKLQALQKNAVPEAKLHTKLASLPQDAPALIIANEFFDALPVRQFRRHDDQWHERYIALDGETLIFSEAACATPPGDHTHVETGEIYEFCPAAHEVTETITRRLCHTGGAFLAIDYGYSEAGQGDSLQAMRSHHFTSPLNDIGESDLTTHVNFHALAATAKAAGGVVHTIISQGQFLTKLGVVERTNALAAANPSLSRDIQTSCDRLIGPDQMGRLFKVFCVTSPGFPIPEGF